MKLFRASVRWGEKIRINVKRGRLGSPGRRPLVLSRSKTTAGGGLPVKGKVHEARVNLKVRLSRFFLDSFSETGTYKKRHLT